MLLAAVVGAILMYAWSSAIHMSPLAQTGFSKMTNEAATLTALKGGTGDKTGLYIFPYADMAHMQAALDANPSGILIYRPAGAKGMTPQQLIGEFVFELFETFVALWLLARTTLGSFGGRLGFMAGVGVLAAVVTNGSYWLWYGYPTDYTVVNMLIEFGKFVFAGLGAAFILGMKPKAAAA
jgi:hypothetical protein